MKTKIILSFAIVFTAPQLSQPMFANITYTYTGNPFIDVIAPYTTSDFVTATVTLASPLAPSMSPTVVTPLGFSLSDGLQTITNLNATSSLIQFGTDANGMISKWRVDVDSSGGLISTRNVLATDQDVARLHPFEQFGVSGRNPGVWTVVSVPDVGSTLALLLLSSTALGGVAQQFKRAAA